MKKLLLLFILFLFFNNNFAQITFDADFESGNLLSATQIDSNYYHVSTVQDIGGRWFYFRISGVQNKYLKVKVITSDVNRPFYSYDNKSFQRFTKEESPELNIFQKTFTEDTVYVSYYIPYTFAYLQERIKAWKKSPYTFVDTIGFTDRGLPLQEIILTDFFENNSQKKHIWIHARTHPGETPGSYHFDGIVEALLKNDDVIDFYRKNLVFHLIPFTNPDGVFYGRSRTNYDGVDVERQWELTDSTNACSEVKAMRKRMLEINNENVISVFLNIHSQASSYCTFWIHTAESTSDYFYQKEYQFANLQTSDNPYFAQDDYRESSLKSYFPEGFLWRNYSDKVMALTYETPYDQYSNSDWVSNNNLAEIGERTVYAIAEYLNLSNPKWVLLDNSDALTVGNWVKDTTGLEFFGDDFVKILPGFGENYIQFSSPELISGNYDIYSWWPSNWAYSYDTNFEIATSSDTLNINKTQTTNGGQWNFIGEMRLDSKDKINVKVTDDNSLIVAADAIRIIYRGPVTGVENNIVPQVFNLDQNYPNPFNPTTVIRFSLAKSAHAHLTVFNSIGQKVADLINSKLNKGMHELTFSGENLSSGVYFYKLQVGDLTKTRGMVLVK